MIWENFEELFHPSWHKKIRPWVESEDCDRVYAFLKKESKRGKKNSTSFFQCIQSI